MIAKISHGANVISLIEYHEQKIKKGTATLLHAQQFMRPNKNLYKAVFEEYISNTRMENPTFHVSLNLPPGEHVNQETFLSMAQDYMDGLGYGRQPYVVYHHHDRQHDHIHIISVNVQENGQRIETYYQHNKSQDITRELEKKYNLTVVSNRKSTVREEVEVYDLKSKSGLKSFIARTNKDVLQGYNPTSFIEYKKLLELHNVKVEKVLDGDKTSGYMFQVKDQPHTVKIKGSELYYRFNESVLERKFSKSAEVKSKYNTRGLSGAIYNILRGYDRINYDDFASMLKEQNISVIYDKYKNGKVYGISFVDHKSGMILKGADVSRQYSIGGLKDIVNDEATQKKLTSILYDAYYAGYGEYRQAKFNVDQLKYIDQGNPLSDMQKWLGENHPERIGEASPEVIRSFLSNRRIAVKKNLEKLQQLIALNTSLEKYFKEYYTNALRSGQVINKLEYIENALDEQFTELKTKVLADSSVKPVLAIFDSGTIDKQFELFRERKHKDRFRIDFQDTLNTFTKDIVNYICPSIEETNSDIFIALTDPDDSYTRDILRDSCLMALTEFSSKIKMEHDLKPNEAKAIIDRQSSFISDMIVKKYAEATLKDEITEAIKGGFDDYKKTQKEQDPETKAKYSSYLEHISSHPESLTAAVVNNISVKDLDLTEFLKQDLKKTIDTNIRAKAKVVPLIRMQEDLSEALREEAKNLTESEKIRISDIFKDPVYIDVLSQSMLDRARLHDEYGNAVRNFGGDSVDRSLRTFLSRQIESMTGWYKDYVPHIRNAQGEYKENVFTGLFDQVLTELGHSKGSRMGKNTARNDKRGRKPRL